jgi:hypothetical protein
MIKAMQMRGFSARTHQSYLAAVTDLARYTKRAPDRLPPSEIARILATCQNPRNRMMLSLCEYSVQIVLMDSASREALDRQARLAGNGHVKSQLRLPRLGQRIRGHQIQSMALIMAPVPERLDDRFAVLSAVGELVRAGELAFTDDLFVAV